MLRKKYCQHLIQGVQLYMTHSRREDKQIMFYPTRDCGFLSCAQEIKETHIHPER